ncbi:hypothetical protein [Ferruginibacter sp.]
MLQDNFKFKYRPVIFFILFYLVMQSCDSSDKSKSTTSNDEHAANDTINYTINPAEKVPLNKFTPADEVEKAERQKMILMQIDSTYAAIGLLDEVKKEMTDLSPAELTVAERNKKSKTIFHINIIQNELTRAVDASILANLRIKTDELAGISNELEKNVSHLQTVAQKLNKATQCIGRLTNILAMGLSKGWIKPFTPKNASVTTVKSTVN